jgi:hypothetical protein
VDQALPKAERAAKSREPEQVARFEVLKKIQPLLQSGKAARALHFDDPEMQKQLKGMSMLTAKKVLYVMNVDEDDLHGQGAMAQRVREHARTEGAECVPVCAKIESELGELQDAERLEMLQSLGLEEPALASLARAAYKLLGLQSYYTAGEKEVRAWTVRVGATAPQAAGVIHTDFEKGFIRAEVYSVKDLQECKSEKAIKEAGRMRIEGKEYVMQDGDVCHFLFNT